MKLTLTLILVLCLSLGGYAQREETTFSRSLSFATQQAPLLILHNVSGNVKVESYSGNTVEIEVQQVLSGKSQRALQQAKDEVELVSRTEGDIIVVYPKTPKVKAKLNGRKLNYNINQTNEDYRFHYDLSVRVPYKTSLRASTINDGDVYVKKLRASDMQLSNINGSVKAEDIDGLSSARTINGDIDITFSEQPSQDIDFNNINGKITVTFPDDLRANVRFKSMNGDLYTNYENVTTGPTAELTTSNKGVEKRYRLDKSTRLQINGGGPQLSFDVLNGNVYVKSY